MYFEMSINVIISPYAHRKVYHQKAFPNCTALKDAYSKLLTVRLQNSESPPAN